ncbi:MAG: beta-lactamase family protein [Saprospiraceae bacterium]|nr:beta-lactamase family protein [Saprospiraceae bacterium]
MKSECRVYIAITLSACIILAGCQKEAIRIDIDAKLEQLYITGNLPSLSTCIFNEDGIQWQRHLGYADQEKRIEVDGETMYHIGSISKLFIVTAIMQLEEQGLLHLDEDINNYLPILFRHPQFPDIPITARMLLTHTSGLSKPGMFNSQNGMWNPFEADMGPPPSEWVPQYLITNGGNFDSHLWQLTEPGTFENYSNIGTCVAAYIVEELSGQDFRTYCKEHIFIPLNMHSTSYNYADLDRDGIALLYDKQGKASTHFDNRVYAAGGIKSTLEDLSYFALCYLNDGTYDGTRIIHEASVRSALEIQNMASGKCLLWNEYLGGWYGHTGGLELGTATTLFIHPDTKIGFIIFTNTHDGIVNPGGEIFWLIKNKTSEYLK